MEVTRDPKALASDQEIHFTVGLGGVGGEALEDGILRIQQFSKKKRKKPRGGQCLHRDVWTWRQGRRPLSCCTRRQHRISSESAAQLALLLTTPRAEDQVHFFLGEPT